jgi:N-acetylmuramoyl-L-alanine amidase
MRHLPPSRVRSRVLAFCGTLLLASALWGQSEPAAPAGKVTAVRFWSLGETTRIAVEIETTGDLHVRSDRLSNPDRIFFDLPGSRPQLGPMRPHGMNVIPVDDRFVQQIRVAEPRPGTTRVVLDLASAVDFVTSELENPSRLIIELRAHGAPAKSPNPPAAAPALVSSERRVFQAPVPSTNRPVAPAPSPAPALMDPPPLVASRVPPPKTLPAPPPTSAAAPPAPLTAKTTPPPAAVTPPETALPARRNSSGDRSMTRALGLKIHRVVLDAGHGGHDTGSIGPDGLREKDLVLDVTRRLGALIEERLSSEVVYTRADDTFIPLERRTRIANEAHADLFLSIHANSSQLRTATGVETYYLNFTTSKTALEVAARENAGAEKTIFELQDLLKQIALKDKVEESREFAIRVQSSLYAASTRATGKSRDRGIRKAPFVVLIGASMPSVLAEIGFVSNTHDEAIMKHPEYRQRIAEALYKGIANYAGTLSHFQVAQSRP